MDAAVSLSGRTVVITGAAQGLGRAYAEAFAARGASAICVDLNADALDATVAAITAAGGRAEGHVLDVADEAAVIAFAAAIAARHPALALLINNAAIAYGLIVDRTALAGLGQDQWLRFLTVNSVAPLTMANALRPMLKAGGGCVINQSSMASTDPLTAYGVTKSALNAMTRLMAGLFAPDGIRVNAIAPGLIASEALAAGLSTHHADHVRAGQLLDRDGSAEDIVALALFLASDAARFITSEIIYCDGGSTRRHWRY